MTWLRRIYLTMAACLAFLPNTTLAQDVSVLIHRTDRGTELFLSGDATTLFSAFGAGADALSTEDGLVVYDDFKNGTWGIGDALLAQTEVRVGGRPVAFEAMSFMLHPKTEPVPFETPLDGMIAIGICNTLSSDERYGLSDLKAYAGYYAQQSATDVPIALSLPSETARGLNVSVSDFGPDGLRDNYTIVLQAGQTVVLSGEPALKTSAIVSRDLLLFLLLALLVAWCCGTVHRRRTATARARARATDPL